VTTCGSADDGTLAPVLARLTTTLLLTLVTAGLLAPAGALGQANPFTPLPTPAPQTDTQTQTVTSTTAAEDQGLKRWQEILMFAGGVILIIGIGYAILRDARRRAPVDDEAAYYADKSPHNAAHAAQRKAAQRKKTKAQRDARKRQRQRR
jgi:hypothetical protein